MWAPSYLSKQIIKACRKSRILKKFLTSALLDDGEEAALVEAEPGEQCNPRSSTLEPQPSTFDPQPSALRPTPHTLHHTPYTLHPTPFPLHPTNSTLNLLTSALLDDGEEAALVETECWEQGYLTYKKTHPHRTLP